MGLSAGLVEWGVSQAGDPVGVVAFFRGEFAVTHGVPELDFSVSAGGDNLSVIGREGDGEDFSVVSHEGSDGLAHLQIPQTESLVP